MKIALTGANGFLGGVIAQHVINAGHSLKCCTSKSSPLLKQLNITPISGRFQVAEVAEELLTDSEVLIHCAGMIHLHYGVNNTVHQVNYKDSVELIHKAIAKGIKHIIFISSIHAFKEKQYELNEYSELEDNKRLAYNYSKAQATLAIENLCREHEVSLDVLFPTAVLGPYNYKGDSLYQLIRLADQWPVLFLPNAKFDVVSVDDVADSCLQSISEATQNGCRRIIISGYPQKMKTISQTYLQILGKKKLHIELPVGLLCKIARLVYLFNKKSAFSPYPMDTLYHGNKTQIQGNASILLKREMEDLPSVLKKIIIWK